MTKFEKLTTRFLSMPKNFSWDELIKLLGAYGYKETNAGKTSGSRIKFIHAKLEPICLHKPHPKPELKAYQLKQILEALRNRGLL
jgi:hypothetical protein